MADYNQYDIREYPHPEEQEPTNKIHFIMFIDYIRVGCAECGLIGIILTGFLVELIKIYVIFVQVLQEF